ncbi:MAG: hypothetical protein ABSF70_01060 [Terracidiphilus sp.]
MGTQAYAGQGRAKPSGEGFRIVAKCLVVNGLLGRQAEIPLAVGEWLASERQKRALGSARATQMNSDGSTGDGPRSRGIVSLRAFRVFLPGQ